MSYDGGRDSLAEPQRAALIARVDDGIQRLQQSTFALKNALKQLQAGKTTDITERSPFNDIAKQGFSQRIFEAFSESSLTFHSLFEQMESIQDSHVMVGSQLSSPTMGEMRLVVGHCVDLALAQSVKVNHCKPSTPSNTEGCHSTEASDSTSPRRSKKRKSIDTHALDDCIDTPRASKIPRSNPLDEDGHTDSEHEIQSRKRSINHDSDSELSERASKIIRITEDKPVRRTIAIEIKKRRAAAKSQRRQPDAETLYSDIPTSLSDAGTTSGYESGLTGGDDDYEDVSAEVEARLKAKEARRKATKGDIKRKRSNDSIGDTLRDVDVRVKATPVSKRRRGDGVNINIYMPD